MKIDTLFILLIVRYELTIYYRMRSVISRTTTRLFLLTILIAKATSFTTNSKRSSNRINYVNVNINNNDANSNNCIGIITTTKLFADMTSSSSSSSSSSTPIPTPSANTNTSSTNAQYSRCGIDYPELVVFDLDACFWDQEMYQMSTIPTKDNIVLGSLSLSNNDDNDDNEQGNEGVIGVYSGRNKISLHTGSVLALQEHLEGIKYPGMKVCFASSADTPFAEKCGRATLKLLEIKPGISIWDIVCIRDWNNLDINQIGRQPPLLSSNKATSHFPNLRKFTNIRYDKMLFFDDCNWGDHCGMVAKSCKEKDTNKGVVTHRTPDGLKESDWRKGIELYKQNANASNASNSSECK